MKDKNSDLDQYPVHHFPRIRNAKGWPGWRPRADTAPPSGKGEVKRARKRYLGYADGGLLLFSLGIIFAIALLQGSNLAGDVIVLILVCLVVVFGFRFLLNVTSERARLRRYEREYEQQENREQSPQTGEDAVTAPKSKILKSDASLSDSIKQRERFSRPTTDHLFRTLLMRLFFLFFVAVLLALAVCEFGKYAVISVAALSVSSAIGLVVYTIRTAYRES